MNEWDNFVAVANRISETQLSPLSHGVNLQNVLLDALHTVELLHHKN